MVAINLLLRSWLTFLRLQGRDKGRERMRQPCWRHSGTRGGTAAEDKGRGCGFAQGHADTGMSRARRERHRRVSGDSGHEM